MVTKLYKQCERAAIPFEILVYDDCSDQKWKDKNSALSASFGVNYLELSENLGRSKIRNWLVKSARYDYVLLLDCDSKILKADFIKKYLAVRDQADVLNGGRVYSKKQPRAKSKYLHWLYGKQKESKPARVRNKQVVNYFHSNNIFAKRSILDRHRFDESLQGYGYEDLVFAQRLMDHEVALLHIDNPIEHLGLETNAVFLNKTENAIQNLVRFERQQVLFNTRMQRLSGSLSRWGLEGIVRKYAANNAEKFKSELIENKGSLFKFQMYKLNKYYEYRDV